VDEEKLGEAEKAIFNAFMNMGTTVFKDAESMECTVARGNSIISLTIYNAGVAKIEVLHNHGCKSYNTLQDILNDVVDTIATALNIDSDKAVDAIGYLGIGTIRAKH
jgi:hypothetical protein